MQPCMLSQYLVLQDFLTCEGQLASFSPLGRITRRMTNVARRPRGLKKVQLYGSKGSSSPYIGTGRAGQLHNIIGLPLREILLM
jgi:hypothetical protein